MSSEWFNVPFYLSLICYLLVKDQGMSGRALRRLPVLALARYIGTGHMVSEPSQEVPIELWLDGLELAVNDITKEKEIIA